MTKLIILQWGIERSIVENLETNEILIMDNNHLMNLDEMGVVV